MLLPFTDVVDSADMRRKSAIGVLTCMAVLFPLSTSPSYAAFENFPVDGSWVVPAGVEIVLVTLTGGSGGDGGVAVGGGPALGGLAVELTAGLTVSAGETIYVGLGENGQDSTTGTATAAASAFNIGPGGKYTQSKGAGGGGGGASAVAIDDDIVLIAGGGGGAGGWTLVDDFFSSYSGKGGDSGATGNRSSWGPEVWTGDGCGGPPEMGAGGLAGSSSNVLTTPSTLTRTGTDGGGAGGDTAAGCQLTGGGAGGAGYYGGLAGTGAGDDLDEYSGGGGGGGSIYRSPTLIGGAFNANFSARGSTPSGLIAHIDITTSSLPDATTSAAYTTALAATFVVALDTWSVSPALPTGLSLDPTTGVISGTPSAPSTANYTFTASKGTAPNIFARSSVTLELAVNAAPTPAPTPEPNSGGTAVSTPETSSTSVVVPSLSVVTPGEFAFRVGVVSETEVVVNAGSYSQFTIEPALPRGLVLDTNRGIIRGTSTQSHEQSQFTITARNSLGESSARIRLAVLSASEVAQHQLVESVRFAAGSARLTRSAKKYLAKHFIRTGRVSVELTGVIPRSGKGSSLARQRSVQVRKYLRAQKVTVNSIIAIQKASNPNMTRRVIVSD